jgi:hypothetical protein
MSSLSHPVSIFATIKKRLIAMSYFGNIGRPDFEIILTFKLIAIFVILLWNIIIPMGLYYFSFRKNTIATFNNFFEGENQLCTMLDIKLFFHIRLAVHMGLCDVGFLWPEHISCWLLHIHVRENFFFIVKTF